MADQPDSAFAAAQERHRKLSLQVTRLEVEIEAATRQVAQLEEEALRLFGVSDPAKLKALLEERTAANERSKQEFSQALTALEAALAALQVDNAAR